MPTRKSKNLDSFEVYERSQEDTDSRDDEHAYPLCSKLAAILAVFKGSNVTNPKLLGRVASGYYTEMSPFEFGAVLADSAQCSAIEPKLKEILKTDLEVRVRAINLQDRDYGQFVELVHFEDDPIQLSAELAHIRNACLRRLQEQDAKQQTVRVYALHDVNQDKLEQVKREMREYFEHGPEIRVFATPEAYYALEGSHRLRAASDLKSETGNPAFNPTLVTFAATDAVPHDIDNLPDNIITVDQILAIHNSGLCYDFEGPIIVLGRHDD